MDRPIKKAVIFDLDGTLLDTLGDLTAAVNHLLNSHGYPQIDLRDTRDYLGNGARELVRLALPEVVDDELLDKYLQEYKAYYNDHSAILTKPYEGVVELLKKLKKAGVLTAVVSNKPDPVTGKLCREYFGELIDFALGDRADIKRKPDAEPVIYAMDKLGCDKAVYVGDSEVDVMTAKNAGLFCLSVTWGFRDKDVLEEHGAQSFVDTAEELEDMLFELLAED